MNTIKTQEEWLIMKSFRAAYPDFPKGKLHKSESPDFTLKQSISRSIGIELTRMVTSQPANIHETTFRSILHHAQEQYLHHVKTPIFVQVFTEDQFNSPINTEVYATRLSIAIIDAVSEGQIKPQFQFSVNEIDLPEGIKRIVIRTDPIIKNTSWELRTEMTVDEIMNKGFIQNLVEKKEEKLKLYQKQIHDNYWLIISADYINTPSGFNLERVIDQIRLKSTFHKLFLYDFFEQKYFELV